ncbi:hypothetical protein B5X24_HaOG206393 [Helicoverpa armigera]|nr:hypothetical protein B5X24_HaOG206393 [Helicoverpa armigera]
MLSMEHKSLIPVTDTVTHKNVSSSLLASALLAPEGTAVKSDTPSHCPSSSEPFWILLSTSALQGATAPSDPVNPVTQATQYPLVRLTPSRSPHDDFPAQKDYITHTSNKSETKKPTHLKQNPFI